MSLKNLVTPPGIDPGTVRLVAQRLNHYATPGPNLTYITPKKYTNFCLGTEPSTSVTRNRRVTAVSCYFGIRGLFENTILIFV